MDCPVCDGKLKKTQKEEYMFSILLGRFPAYVCDKCKESFTDSETTARIEDAAKKKGIWGLGKQTKITRSGNSLAVRIPKNLARYLKLKEGQEAYIHPEGNRLVIEN